MNLIQSLVATGTIALVSFSSLPIALSETVNPTSITSEPAQVLWINRTFFYKLVKR